MRRIKDGIITPFWWRIIPSFFAGVGVFFLDQAVKWYAMTSWQDVPHVVWSWLSLVHEVNHGMSFGVPLPVSYVDIVMLLGCVLLVAGGGYAWRTGVFASRWIRYGYGVLLGGVLSNVLDRVVYGGVVDYVVIVGLTVINIADIAIIGGACAIVYGAGTMRKN